MDGVTTAGTLLGAQASGLTQVVLASDDAQPTVPTTATPDALGPLNGSGLQVVTSDSTLAGLAANDPRLLGNPTLARLRILAETAMIAAERPSDPRSVVVALPRGWAPSAAWAKAMLTLDHVAPWIVPTDLTDLTTIPGDAPARRLGAYPESALQAEVSQQQLRPVAQTFSRLRRFGQILTNPDAFVPSFTAALRRAQSAAWREHPADGQAYADKVVRGAPGGDPQGPHPSPRSGDALQPHRRHPPRRPQRADPGRASQRPAHLDPRLPARRPTERGADHPSRAARPRSRSRPPRPPTDASR